MLIKEFRVCDFLVFSGEQVLALPTEEESNIVVILAPNNTGKTNIIRALKFLFYGHLPDCTEATAFRLIHDGLKATAKTGSKISGWVEVTLELDGEELSLRRTVSTRKFGENECTAPELVFGQIIRGYKLELRPDSNGIFQTKLRTMVPEQLFDAFYFKGEPLDGKLLGGVTAIRESLISFLHEDRWQDAEKAAEAVRQRYTWELSKLTEQHEEYNKLLSGEELFRNHMLKEQEKHVLKKQQLADATSQFDDLTVRLQELGTGGDAERHISQLREIRIKLDAARKVRERSDADIARLVGASRGIPFLLEALPAARRILVQMQEDNILPADVSERFVNRILSAECCVCGRAHTDDTRLEWTRYKERTLSVDLNRGLSDLLNAVNDSHSHSFAKLSAEMSRKLQAALDTRKRAIEEIEQFSSSVTDLEQKLQTSPIEEIRTFTQQVRKLAASRERLKGELTQLEDSISGLQKRIKHLKSEMERAKPSGAIAKKERELQKARTRTEKLRLLIQESREILNRSFHDLLQASVTEYYDRSAYDGSKARVISRTLLPAIEINGQVHGNLGGGQSQLLALAYIVSLSRLRKSLHLQMQKLGIGLGRVDDQSFFLDSPFNHVTEHYAHAIASFLNGNARQVVLLLARQQWNLVRSIIEPAASRIVAFKYYTLKDKLEELQQKDPKLEDFTYPVNGKRIRLIEQLSATVGSPHTVITTIA